MKNISRLSVSVCLMALVLLLCGWAGARVDAGMNEGWAAYQKGDYAAAFKEFKPPADQGDQVAQNSLGYMYQHGQGVEKNPAEALQWYKKAAGQGNIRAMNNIAAMYDQGDGVQADKAEAAKWWLQAAEKGSSHAQNKLAWMYEQGEGVAKDLGQAKNWYAKAAERGHKKAKVNLDRILAAEKTAAASKPAPTPKPKPQPAPAPPKEPAPKPEPAPQPEPGDQAETGIQTGPVPQPTPPTAQSGELDDLAKVFKGLMGELEKEAKVDIGLISISTTGFRIYDLVVEPNDPETKKISAGLIEIREVGVRPTDGKRFLFSGAVKDLVVEQADQTTIKLAVLDLDRLDVDTENENISLAKALIKGIQAQNPMGGAAIDSVEVEGARFEGEKSFALKRFEIKNVVSDEGMIGGSSLKRFVVENVNLPDFDQPKDWELGLFALEDLKINQMGQPLASLVKLSNATQKEGTRIESELILDQLTVTDKVPYKPFIELMAKVGRKSLTLNVGIKGLYDTSDGLVDLSGINFSMPELGRLDVALKMSGIDAVTEMDDKAVGDFMTKAAFHGLKMSYKDDGLVQILVNLAAAEEEQEPAQFVEGLKAMLKQQAEGMGPVFVPLVEQMIKFLDKPVAIHLSALPDQPVPVAAISEFKEDEMVQKLKVEVKAD